MIISCCCSVTHSCLTLCNPMDCSMPGFPVFHYLLELLKLMCVELMMPFNHFILCCPFSSCLQSFPASGSFPVSRLFTKGGQSVGASASASVLPIYIQDWFPLGLTGLISFLSRGLSRVFFSSTVGKHQPSFWSTSPICTWLLENHSFNYMDLCWQSDLIFKVLIIWLQWSNCIDYFSPTWILV